MTWGRTGTVLGGAAGFEVDRADERLGTPPEAVLVARAAGFSDAYQGAVEDITTADSRQGGSVCELVRSDVIFMTTESGGAVFSVGSIAWCGSLGSNGGKNDVATATRNVLERFADPNGSAIPVARTCRPCLGGPALTPVVVRRLHSVVRGSDRVCRLLWCPRRCTCDDT